MTHTVIKHVSSYGIHLKMYIDGEPVGEQVIPHEHKQLWESTDDTNLLEDARVKGDRNIRAYKAFIN